MENSEDEGGQGIASSRVLNPLMKNSAKCHMKLMG